MKKWIAVMVMCVATAGCSGVIMSPRYSTLLDKWVTVAEADARMALDGTADANDMRSALVDQYAAFKQFQDARDGRESDVAKAVADAKGVTTAK